MSSADTLTDAELREAYAVCRRAGWSDYPAEMGDPTRRAIVEACATGRRRKAQRAQAAPVRTPAPACTTPLPQQPLVAHWPRRRAMPTDFVDHKRAAAGDRDD